MPTTGSGKILKTELRKNFANTPATPTTISASDVLGTMPGNAPGLPTSSQPATSASSTFPHGSLTASALQEMAAADVQPVIPLACAALQVRAAFDDILRMKPQTPADASNANASIQASMASGTVLVAMDPSVQVTAQLPSQLETLLTAHPQAGVSPGSIANLRHVVVLTQQAVPQAVLTAMQDAASAASMHVSVVCMAPAAFFDMDVLRYAVLHAIRAEGMPYIGSIWALGDQSQMAITHGPTSSMQASIAHVGAQLQAIFQATTAVSYPLTHGSLAAQRTASTASMASVPHGSHAILLSPSMQAAQCTSLLTQLLTGAGSGDAVHVLLISSGLPSQELQDAISSMAIRTTMQPALHARIVVLPEDGARTIVYAGAAAAGNVLQYAVLRSLLGWPPVTKLWLPASTTPISTTAMENQAVHTQAPARPPVGSLVSTAVHSILDRTLPVDSAVPLMTLGLTSTMAVQLVSDLESGLGVQLPATLVFDYPSVASIVSYLEEMHGELNNGIQYTQPAASVLMQGSVHAWHGGAGPAAFSSSGAAFVHPHASVSMLSQQKAVQAMVLTAVQQVLDLPASSSSTTCLRPDAPLMVQGLTSTAAVQLVSSLEQSFNLALPATLVFDYPTIADISTFLQEQGASLPSVPHPGTTTAASDSTSMGTESSSTTRGTNLEAVQFAVRAAVQELLGDAVSVGLQEATPLLAAGECWVRP